MAAKYKGQSSEVKGLLFLPLQPNAQHTIGWVKAANWEKQDAPNCTDTIIYTCNDYLISAIQFFQQNSWVQRHRDSGIRVSIHNIKGS
jgi:hypothetical protein